MLCKDLYIYVEYYREAKGILREIEIKGTIRSTHPNVVDEVRQYNNTTPFSSSRSPFAFPPIFTFFSVL